MASVFTCPNDKHEHEMQKKAIICNDFMSIIYFSHLEQETCYFIKQLMILGSRLKKQGNAFEI